MKSMMFLFVFIITQNGFANTIETMPDGSTFEVRLIAEAPATFDEIQQHNFVAREQCSTSTQKRLDLQGLITLGKEIWQIVKDGAPVVNFKSESASVIPQGALCPFYMSNWSLPLVKTFELNYKNKFGMEMIYFTYKVIYSYGGSYQGKGSYLANVSIHPKDIRLKWGQSFDASVKIASALNMGTVENPIAGLEISLDWVIQNPIMNTQSNRTYFVDGLGNLVAL